MPRAVTLGKLLSSSLYCHGNTYDGYTLHCRPRRFQANLCADGVACLVCLQNGTCILLDPVTVCHGTATPGLTLDAWRIGTAFVISKALLTKARREILYDSDEIVWRKALATRTGVTCTGLDLAQSIQETAMPDARGTCLGIV